MLKKVFSLEKNFVRKKVVGKKFLSKNTNFFQKNVFYQTDFVADFVSDKSVLIFYSTYNKTLQCHVATVTMSY